MFDVRRLFFVGNHETYIEHYTWFINTSLWLIYINQQLLKTGDSQNQKGIGSGPDPFGAGAYYLQSISALCGEIGSGFRTNAHCHIRKYIRVLKK